MDLTTHRAGRWLVRYAHHLIELHRLIAAGQDESAAGDALRDAMDADWQRLTPEEVRMVRDLSADLSTADQQAGTVEVLPASLDAQISQAAKAEDWVKLLRILRENLEQIPLASAAYLRGVCWAELGLPEAAARFFWQAAQLQPDHVWPRMYFLGCLLAAGEEQQALPVAQQWAQAATDSALQLLAAQVLFLNAEASAEPEASARLHRMVIETAEKAIRNPSTSGSDELWPSLEVNAWLHMAMSYLRLGDAERARAASLRAKELAPDNLNVLMVRGYLSDVSSQPQPGPLPKLANQLRGDFPGFSESFAWSLSRVPVNPVVISPLSTN